MLVTKKSSRWLYLMKHNAMVDGEREINLNQFETSYNWWQIIELLDKSIYLLDRSNLLSTLNFHFNNHLSILTNLGDV
jgi:hypothetical protein